MFAQLKTRILYLLTDCNLERRVKMPLFPVAFTVRICAGPAKPVRLTKISRASKRHWTDWEVYPVVRPGRFYIPANIRRNR